MEALEPMRASEPIYARREDWINAARLALNLSKLELTLGDVAGALRDAEESVAFAERSGDAWQRMSKRTALADALHQAGKYADALALFREAEAVQAKHQPEYPLLYSLQGFQYCDLLLAEVELAAWQRILNLKSDISRPGLEASCRELEQRAAQTLTWAESQKFLLDIALDHLSLGRVGLYGAILGNRRSEIPDSQCRSHVAAARRLIDQCGYHRRDGELADAEAAIG